MKKSLVLVESPAKVKTIAKFLKSDRFTVEASMGHVIDLPKSRFGVDVDKDFAPHYVVVAARRKVLTVLKKAAADKQIIFVATDPDREGEAIGWHLARRLGEGKEILRVKFNEITREAVTAAFDSPGKIDERLVNAQQARRLLDRIVGYKLSPLLWKKVRRGLSAGRVQSVALRLLVEREGEIEKFVLEEYWELEAELKKILPAGDAGKAGAPFPAKLEKLDGEKARIRTREEGENLVQRLGKEKFVVAALREEKRKRQPGAPFNTSKLQQEAFNRLRFPAGKTMRVAQQLYEGVEIGDEGSVGLITYMRTDSLRVADSALAEVRRFITEKYGPEYLSPAVRTFASRKLAQEAHEAIRPTSVGRTPESLQDRLSPDEIRLYRLIWERFVASQMTEEERLLTAVEIKAGAALFVARGSRVLFPGFTSVYAEDGKPAKGKGKSGDILLPPLAEGETLKLLRLLPSQHFTQPPPRYSDAGLVKVLEEKGIGRPSTYAPIIQTLVTRNYVARVKGYFHPTELGKTVTGLLVQHFPDILDVEFTARMEEELDRIEEGRIEWVEVLREFYRPFAADLERAGELMRDVKKEQEVKTDIRCERCGEPMVVKMGRWGKFLACSGFPRCRSTRPLVETPAGEIRIREEEKTDQLCPQCGQPMVVKWGRNGKFLACSRYPECKGTRSVAAAGKCPQAGCGGDLVRRRSQKGRFFYGCSNYPKCKYVAHRLPEESASAGAPPPGAEAQPEAPA